MDNVHLDTIFFISHKLNLNLNSFKNINFIYYNRHLHNNNIDVGQNNCQLYDVSSGMYIFRFLIYFRRCKTRFQI